VAQLFSLGVIITLMDTQIVELLGKQHLTSALLRAGLEVATPIRDRGIDMIAYADIDRRVTKFVSRPIQMKAAMNRSFSVNSKYERVRDLLIAYVWDLRDQSQTAIYCLTYQEAYSIAKHLGWTSTASFKRGGYSTSQPSAEIVSLLRPYFMTPDSWWQKVTDSRNDT
jgi:hypothetical protein